MQTSLARRERRRRNGNARRGGGPGSRIASILPIFLLGTFFVFGGVTFVGAVQVYNSYSAGLTDPRQALDNINYNQQTVLYDKTGTVQLAAFGSENRRVLKFSEIPNSVLDATTSAEDRTFWSNTGFDPAAILSSLRDAVFGRPRGASTITQQLVRTVPDMLPPSTSTVDRKIKEVIQSIRLTQEFPGDAGKQAVITAYLNINFFGNRSYGIAAAAQGYFGVTDLSKLTVAQAAIIAGLLQAPSAYDLVANADEMEDGSLVVADTAPIVQRRNWILEEMRRNNKDGVLRGTYTDAQLAAAETEPVVLHPASSSPDVAPQFDLIVRQQLAELLCGSGATLDECSKVDTGGYKVITTLDATMQKSAERWLRAYVICPNQANLQADIDCLAAVGVTATGDPYDYSRIIGPSSTSTTGLRNSNIHNGALIALDYRTGQVLAYAGSAGFYEKAVKNPAKNSNLFDPQYDVLSSGVGRQPGSAFKPIDYLIGIQDKTMTASTMFMDVATDFGGGYLPHDADGYERGPVRLRSALQYSLNIPAVKAAAINTVPHIMARAQDFGLEFPDNANPGLSIGVGTVEVRPADLVSAYGAIANSGALVTRNMIVSVTDSHGNAVGPIGVPKTTHPSTPQATYVMTNILAGNTDPAQNNWWSQYKLTSGNTRRPATLKTGTSDQTEDLFAVGYTAPPADNGKPAIVAGVWAGNSDRSVGNSVMSLELAAPIWHAFMLDATSGTPVTDFTQPSGVTWATVDANSGMLPGAYTTQTVKEVFIDGTVPTAVDNTKVPTDVDTVTNSLWTWDCPGTKETKGLLDLSQVDAGNDNYQKYDAIWIARARQGVGVKGGPNNGATQYFYQSGFWTPFGQTWGAPFAPTTYCTQNTGSPPPATPSPSPTASPTPKPTASPTPKATATHTPTPTHTATPGPTPSPSPSAPAGGFLVPLPLLGLLRLARRGSPPRR
jgi:penicillin-binding protein 1A